MGRSIGRRCMVRYWGVRDMFEEARGYIARPSAFKALFRTAGGQDHSAKGTG